MTPDGLKNIAPSDLGSSQYAWSFEVVTAKESISSKCYGKDADKVLERREKLEIKLIIWIT